MFSGLLDAYKKELDEFVAVVKEDTSRVVHSAAEKLKQLNEASHSEEEEEENSRAKSSHALSTVTDFRTFLEQGSWEDDPSFEDFQETFDMQSRLEQLESARDQVKDEFDSFVPDLLNEEDFWVLYFFYLHVQRRARLLAGEIDLPEDDDDFSWGDEEETTLDTPSLSSPPSPKQQDEMSTSSTHPQEQQQVRVNHPQVEKNVGESGEETQALREEIDLLKKELKAALSRAESAEAKVEELTRFVAKLQQQESGESVRSDESGSIIEETEYKVPHGEVKAEEAVKKEQGFADEGGELRSGDGAEAQEENVDAVDDVDEWGDESSKEEPEESIEEGDEWGAWE